jgi:hypothetical protein
MQRCEWFRAAAFVVGDSGLMMMAVYYTLVDCHGEVVYDMGRFYQDH